MKKYGIPIIILLLLIFLIYWFFIKEKGSQEKLSEEERVALIEDSAISNDSQPNDINVFPNTPIGIQLSNHMMILALPAETMEEADAKYNASLSELKKNPVEVVVLLNKAYKKTEVKHYFNRWAIVKTLGDLESIQTIKPLSDIIFSEIPPETSMDLHHFSTQEEEVIIRIRAIEGLGMLSKRGDSTATRILLQLALDSTIKNSALRLRSIKAYLRGGRNTDERVQLLKSRLDKSLFGIITVSTTEPEEFIKKMEGTKKLSDENTKKEDVDRPSTPTTAPKIKGN